MPDLVFLAIAGLLLLIPIEIAALVIIAAARRAKKFPEPKLKIPEIPRQERYGWEDYLKLSPEKKPSMAERNVAIVSIFVIFAVLLALPFAYFAASPPALNLSFPGFGKIADKTVEAPLSANISNITKPELNLSMFSNFSVSHGASLPRLNLSAAYQGTVTSYAPYIVAASVAVALLLLGLAVFVLVVRHRRLAVLKKARKTAEKLMEQAEKPKAAPKPAGAAKRDLRSFIAPAIILAFLIIIAALVFLLRGKIRGELSASVMSALLRLRDFAVAYRLYIAVGVVLLVIVIAALRYFAGRKSK